MDPSRARNGSADLAAPALIGFTRAERHRSRALCRRWRWIHGQAGLDGVIPKLPAPPSPWEGSLWTPHCFGHPSSRAQGRGTHLSTFIIIPGSKFSSFGIFSPTVVALSSSSPLKFRTPYPVQGHKARLQSEWGGGGGFPIPLEKDPLFPHHICGTWRSRCNPEGHGISQGQGRIQHVEPKVLPHIPAGTRTLLDTAQLPPAKVANPIRIGVHPSLLPRDGIRSRGKQSRNCPAHGWDKL